MILQSWRILNWRRNCSSNATTQAFSTFQILVDLIPTIIWPQCLLHRLQNIPILEAEVMEDCTTCDGLHCKLWLNFQGLEKN